MKKLIFLILLLPVFVYFCLPISKSYSADSIISVENCDELLSVYGDEKGGFYLLCNCADKYKIVHINEELTSSEYSLDISVGTDTYAYFDDKFYFFENSTQKENDKENHFLTIHIFDCNSTVIKTQIINNAYTLSNRMFAVDSDCKYYVINSHSVDVYSKNSIFEYSFDIGSMPYNLANSLDGSAIYCTHKEGIAVISGESFISYPVNANNVFVRGNNYFSTDFGEVYINDGTSLSYVCSFNGSSNGVAVLNDCVLGIDNGKLTAVIGDERIGLFDVTDNAFLCSSDDNYGCFAQQNGRVIGSFMTLDEIESSIEEAKTAVDSISDISIFDEDKYKINSERNIITGIEPSSTVATLKSYMDLSTCSAVFYDCNGNLKKSGTIGTGGMIDITLDNSKFTYTIVVYGDLSGEGNINSNDQSYLIKHLLGESPLDGYAYVAADLNGDACVDLKDLVVMNDYLNGQGTINQKR